MQLGTSGAVVPEAVEQSTMGQDAVASNSGQPRDQVLV